MEDDMIVSKLRRLAEAQPPVTVDRTGVLRAGRRRRLARTAGTTGAALAITVGAFPALAALSPDPLPVAPAWPSPTETATPTPRAVVDHEAGTITMPIDELDPDADDWSVTQTARAHFIATCMTERGFAEHWSFDGPVLYEPQPGTDTPYGVWRESDVRATGYGHVTQTDPGRSLDGEEDDAYRECDSQLVDAGLSIGTDQLSELAQEHDAPGGWQGALETDEGRALREQWSQCLTDEGVQAPKDPTSMIPDGIDQAPLEEQVRVGLIDVACKERLDLVQQLADLDAAQQARYLEQREQFTAALQEMEEPILDQAISYLTEHGIPLP